VRAISDQCEWNKHGISGAKNYLGTGALNDYQYKYVIDTLMEFYQFQFPKTYVGPGYYYDYYRIDLKGVTFP